MDLARATIARIGDRFGTARLVPTSEEVQHSTAYRPEIDGLRAVAVVPVVFFHAGLSAFSGGFVGVDVFFVISGYLITGLLYRECVRGDFSVARFYERRIRRIFPVLFVVLLATLVAGLLLLVPVELETLGKRIAATTLFVSNIFYWQHSGYFDEKAFDNPLLHTWSLAVEEQFYIIFPVALWLLVRSRVKLRTSLGIVAITSFALSAYTLDKYPTATFFMLPTRAWELMLGGVLALVPTYKGRFAGPIAAAGVAAILLATFTYREGMPFPGPAALLPCVGAAAIIAVWGSQPVGSLLASGPFRGVGLISYSLYLWHRPILVFAALFVGWPLPPAILVEMLVLSFALSIASWYFIEQPVRRWRSRRRLWMLGVACIAGGLALSAAVVVTDGLPQRYSADANRILTDAARQKSAHEADYKCGQNAFAKHTGPCAIGAAGPPQLVVIGDSHAMALKHVLDQMLSGNGTPGTLISIKGCPPLLDFQRVDKGCAKTEAKAFEFVKANRPKAVLLVARWDHSLFDVNSVAAAAMSSDDESRLDNVTGALAKTIAAYHALGIRVGVLLPVPGARENVARNLARGLGAPLAYSEREERQKLAAFKAKVIALHPDAIGDPADVFCHGICMVEANGEPLYIDDNHVNANGAKIVAPVVRKLVGQLLK